MIPIEKYGDYTKRVGNLDRNGYVLSASAISGINQVFYADDLSSPCVTPRNLSVRYVDQENFHRMVVGDPELSAYFEPATLYIVSSDEINAYNTNIRNVADPVEPKDASNKRYVDEKVVEISSLSDYVVQKFGQISANDAIHSFHEAVKNGGVDVPLMQATVSAIYQLINIFGYS